MSQQTFEGSRPRLAVVTDLMAPYRVPLFNALADRLGGRLRVFFMAASAENRLWKSSAPDALFDYSIVEGSDLATNSGAGFNHFWNPKMFTALSDFDPDVVVIGGYHHLTSYVVLAFAKLRRRKLVLWSESTAMDKRSNSVVLSRIKKWFVHQCDAFLTPGRASRDYLISLGADGKRIYRAPNSIDVNAFEFRSAHFRSPRARRKFRELHDLPEFLILFVGRLAPEKGFPLIVQLVARLQNAGHDVGLIVAGDGDKRVEYREASLDLKPGSALFVGFVQQAQLPLYYAQSDVLVLPSSSEPWGLVVNEALSCHLPVLCSPQVGACYELITDGETGFVCRNLKDYFDVTEKLISDPANRIRMGNEAAARARQYGPEASAEGFEECLRGFTGVELTRDPVYERRFTPVVAANEIVSPDKDAISEPNLGVSEGREVGPRRFSA